MGRLAAGLLPAAAIAYLASAPIVGATLDVEDYRNTVLSSLLHARGLVDGRYPFWTSTLAFGLPLPLHPALLLHPVTPLLAVMRPEEVVRIFYALHAVIGAGGCWWLVRHLGVSPALSGVAAATWALSTPALQYAVTDFWMSYFLGWSLFPFLVVLTLRVLEARRARQMWTNGIGLGCVAGMLLANGHAGQTSVLLSALAVLALVERRQAQRVFPALAIAAVIAAFIAAPSLVPLMQEVPRFPDLPRLPVDSDLNWHTLLDAPLRPLLSVHPSEWLATVEERGTRVPFFGGPLLLAAVAAAFGRARPLPHGPAFVATFALSATVMVLPASYGLDAMSGTVTFRDPTVLLGIVLGTLALQRWSARRPGAVAAIVVLQLVVLSVAAWPFISGAWRNGRQIEAAFLRHSPTTAALHDWTQRLQGRWYLAPRLDELVRRGFLEDDGLAPDAWVYRGLPVVNGTFKGVSLDAFYASGTLPIGRIRGEAATVASQSTLSVLGIGAVLAIADEPVAPELEEVARFETGQGPLRLLRTPGIWPGAAFVDAYALATELPVVSDCVPGGLLCRDFGSVASAGPGSPIRITRAEGRLTLEFDPHPSVRWMLVSEMYRPQWTATASGAGRSLRVAPAWGALIAVEVPAGVSGVVLDFRPSLMRAAVGVAVFTLAAATATLLWLTRRGHAERRRLRRLSRASPLGDNR